MSSEEVPEELPTGNGANESVEASSSAVELNDDDKGRYILQYLLSCRGVCHEDMLLLVLQKLDKYSTGEENSASTLDSLSEIIKKINVKLNPLSYKIIKVSHGIGKRVVSTLLRSTGSSGNSNKFYVYVNTVSSDESKLATRFSQREIEFVKWAVEQMCDASERKSSDNSLIAEQLHQVRSTTSEDGWRRCITYSVPSKYLLQYEEMSASEIEDLVTRLCELKWFYKDNLGRVAMDLRCLVELEEYLLSNGIPACQGCHRLAVQGVQCESCSMAWHVDCYQHYVTHVSRICPCGKSIVEDGVYVV